MFVFLSLSAVVAMRQPVTYATEHQFNKPAVILSLFSWSNLFALM